VIWVSSLLEWNLGNTKSVKVCLDQQACTRWTASLVLDIFARSPDGIPVASFLDKWRALVPESWRDSARVDDIEDMAVRPSASTIASKSAVPAAAESNAPAASTKARKWHEKFKRSRR
jgi:Sister chromatid cohesion protein Dcc1